ncbi:MAG: triose-phosphate isomerase [Candidatus Saganbacteria bacterium]|nr:triose-phosphate isomerase [Candidatus Saganbacteria bacterium]
MGEVSLGSVQTAWRAKAGQRGYNFGFNLKTLLPRHLDVFIWAQGAKDNKVAPREGLAVTAFFPPVQIHSADTQRLFEGNVGVQEIHWDKPGSHTGAAHAETVLSDFPRINAVLVNHSEVIGEHGRTLEQAAGQLKQALRTTESGRTFKFITICVGEDRATYDKGTEAAAAYVQNQVRTILTLAGVTEEDMARIGIAYEPRFAIQVGDVPGVPPTDAHIAKMGWAILQAAAEAVSVEGMSQMFALQYGGSMKGPDDKTAPVQRFVGPGNSVDADLYNGGLIGTAAKDPKVAAAIVNRVVPVPVQA